MTWQLPMRKQISVVVQSRRGLKQARRALKALLSCKDVQTDQYCVHVFDKQDWPCIYLLAYVSTGLSFCDWYSDYGECEHLTTLCAGVAVTLGVLRAAEVGQATVNFFSSLLGSNKPKPPNAQ